MPAREPFGQPDLESSYSPPQRYSLASVGLGIWRGGMWLSSGRCDPYGLDILGVCGGCCCCQFCAMMMLVFSTVRRWQKKLLLSQSKFK